MNPMIYLTIKGTAEVTGYDGHGNIIDGYRVVYDDKNIPDEMLKDDGAFATWVFRNSAAYKGNHRRHERPDEYAYKG